MAYITDINELTKAIDHWLNVLAEAYEPEGRRNAQFMVAELGKQRRAMIDERMLTDPPNQVCISSEWDVT